MKIRTLSPRRRGDAEKNEKRRLLAAFFHVRGFSATLRLCGGTCFFLVLLFASDVFAYPDFQQYIKKHSGRAVDCAYCHANPNGPEGNGPGQIGSLTPEEFDRLNFARSAFDPGRNVNSPILNAFGNRIIRDLGKKRFLEIKTHPEELAQALGPVVDLDGDGIPDSQEFLDGTHPLKDTDGDPWRLFRANVQKNKTPIFLLVLATIFGLYGLNNLLKGFDRLLEGNGHGEGEDQRL